MQYVHLNKIGKELVLDLISKDNQAFLPKPLTFSDVEFSVPEEIESSEGERNTKVLVTAPSGSKYSGEILIAYWRLDFDVLFNEELSTIGLTGPIVDTYGLIEILNDRFGLMLTEDDVLIEPIDVTTLPTEYVLKAKEGSYAYCNEVTLTLTDDLAYVIYADILNGFNYPGPLIVS